MGMQNTENNKRWFIILTEPQRETRAVVGLVARRFEVFGPSIYLKQPVMKHGQHIKDEKGRKLYKKVERPMFPGYVFAKFERGAERFEDARKVSGVREFLKFEGVPATLPNALVDAMRREENKQLGIYEESVKVRTSLEIPFIQYGPARIEGGPYDDWVGKMIKLDKKGRVTMLLKQFGRETPVLVDGSQIRAA